MLTFINLHTHKSADQEDTLEIVNVHHNFSQVPSKKACSVGLHPWYLSNASHEIKEVEQMASLPNVLAIGECGLDRVCDTPWEDQCNAFIPQIALANTLRKPLIIHCVRAYDELEILLQQQRNNVPVIIHGFNRKQTIADKLLGNGYNISFGRALMNEGAPAQAVFRNIPMDRFFLETDNSDISIKDIYTKAADIKETSLDGIILQVQQNFKKVFA